MSSGLKELDGAIPEASKPPRTSPPPQSSQPEAKDEKEEKGEKGGKGGERGKDAKDAKKQDKTKVSYWYVIVLSNNFKTLSGINFLLVTFFTVTSHRAGHLQ